MFPTNLKYLCDCSVTDTGIVVTAVLSIIIKFNPKRLFGPVFGLTCSMMHFSYTVHTHMDM